MIAQGGIRRKKDNTDKDMQFLEQEIAFFFPFEITICTSQHFIFSYLKILKNGSGYSLSDIH